MNFSDALKRFRNEFNVTQKSVAEIIGISERAYSEYERGSAKMSAVALLKLADAFDISADYLLGRTDRKSFVSVKQADTVDMAVIAARNAADKRLAEVRAEGKNPSDLEIAREYADTLLREYHDLMSKAKS